MAFRVFLSYSTDPDEQALVWRIQTLAAAQGIQVFVPQRTSSVFPSSPRGGLVLSEGLRSAIDQSDCVLAIITSKASPAVEKELNYALGKNKLIIPIVEQEVGNHTFLSRFTPIFRFSRWDTNPGKVETEISRFLMQRKLNKELQQGMGALVAIGLGLFLLANLSKK